MTRILQPAFTGGLVDADLDVRTETALYGYSCKVLENFIVKSGGGIFRRPGMKHIFRQDRPARLIPFQFNREQVYILIFVEGGIHVILEDQILHNGVFPSQIDLQFMVTTPYSATDIFELDYSQSADKLFLTHPDHATGTLIRKTPDVFEFDFGAAFNQPDFNPVFVPQRSVATMEGTGSGGSDIVRYQYQVITEAGLISIPIDLIITAGFLPGNWPVGKFAQVVVVVNQGADPNIPKIPFRIIFYKERAGLFGFVGQAVVLNPTFEILVDPVINGGFEAEWNASGSGTNEFYLTGPSGSDLELVKPAGIMRDTTLTVEATLGSLGMNQWGFGDNDSLGFETLYFRDSTGVAPVLTPVSILQFTYILIDNNFDPDVTDSPINLKSDFSTTDNRPITVTLHQNRLWFGGTNSAPQTLFASRISNFVSFARTEASLAADAMELPIVSNRVNEIKWMEPFNNDLLIGTAGSEWRIAAPDGAALFAANIVARPLSGWGSEAVKPVVIGNTILFVEAGGKDIRDFFQAVQPEGFTGSGGNYLTKLIRNLLEDRRVTDMAYQRSPESVLWCVLDDGVLLAVTYLKEAQIIAWHRHPTDGKVQSVAVIPGTNGDRVYLSVQRECGFTTVRIDDRWNGNDITEAFLTDEFEVFDGSLVNEESTWTKSASGINEYFVTPGVSVLPSLIYENRIPIDQGTLGSLAVGEWDYGDNDSLGFDTVYVRLTDEVSPQSKADDFVSIYATVFSGLDHLNCSIRDSRFTWVASGGSNQFQLKSLPLDPPNFTTFLPELPFVYEDGQKMVRGTFPTLEPGEYDYTLLSGNSHYFVRLTDEADPDTKPAGFIATSVEDNDGVNQKLSVLADGSPIADVTLDFEGTFTLDEPAFRVCAGLPYTSKVSPLDVEVPSDPRKRSAGSLGLTKSIDKLILKVRDTVGGKIGPDESRLQDLRTPGPVQFDTAAEPFSGYLKDYIPGGNNKQVNVIIVQDQPLPMTISALIPNLNVKDQGI